ncbi:hypothetical protein DFH27DRAFT_475387 [Peziza echinospora]|nr:hypothetical protein DFH27DRAFT_475387 [Peziza echinospora]
MEVRGNDFRSLTPAMFCQVLLAIRPKAYLPRGRRGYFDVWQTAYDSVTGRGPQAKIVGLATARKLFLGRLESILADMKKRGIPLGLYEYTHLIDCARATGNSATAKQLWQEMSLRGIQRDTKCYNTYLAAVCGTTLTQSTWKTNPRTIANRQLKSTDDVATFALKTFDSMVKEGLRPDITTFDLILLAQAKMGNLQHVRSLILKCWGTDIASESLSPVEDATSCLNLKPLPQTLSNIAISLSQVGKPAAAIRLIGYLSRTYSITVPFQTWMHLLSWTYNLSRPPAATRLLPESAMTELWKIMQDEPYNVVPDIEMYDYIIRHHISGQRFKIAENLMGRAIKQPFKALQEQCKLKLGQMESKFGVGNLPGAPPLSYVPKYHVGMIGQTFSSKSAAGLDLELYRARSMIKRWVELLIHNLPTSEKKLNSRRSIVPNVVGRYWHEFLGSVVSYPTGTGFLQLKTGAEKFGLPIRRTRSRGAWRWMGVGNSYGGKKPPAKILGMKVRTPLELSEDQKARRSWLKQLEENKTTQPLP